MWNPLNQMVKIRLHLSASMTRHRCCALLTMWMSDPRIPLNRDSSTDQYYIGGDATPRIGLKFCPFCGDQIDDSERSVRPKRGITPQLGAPERCATPQLWVKAPPCEQMAELTRLPNSPVKYRRAERDYYVAGRDISARLFYCPICGCKILPPGRDKRFYKKSVAELEHLKTRSQGITTIDDAITKLGPPDIDHGPSFAYLYLGGEPTRFGAVRTLFYTELAKTIMIIVSEGLSGK